MRLRLRTLAALIACSAVLPQVQALASSKPLLVGFAIAKSGWMSNYDLPPYRAALLRISQLNNNGGLLGRKIVYKVEDTKTNRSRSAIAGKELVQDNPSLLVVSCDYDFGSPAALAGNRAHIITMSLCASDARMGVQGVGKYVFSASTASQAEGITIADWARKNLKGKHAFVLEDTSINYNKSACAGFRAGWKRAGGDIVGEATFKNGDPSVATQIQKIKNTKPTPDVIYLCSVVPGGATATKQIRDAGISTPILADTAMSGNYWLNAVPKLNNFYVPTWLSLTGDDPRPGMNKFVKQFTKKWGKKPVSPYSVLGYCLISEWAAAVKKAHSTNGPEVLKVLNSYRKKQFLCGPTTYTKTMHIQTTRPYLIMEAHGGRFHSIGMYKPAFKPSMKLLFRVGQ